MARNGKNKNCMLGSVMSHSLLILETNKIMIYYEKIIIVILNNNNKIAT